MEQKNSRAVVGLVQISNSFADQSYLPYSVGILQAYCERYSTNANRYKFLIPIYRRLSLDLSINKLISADIVAFSTYVWNIRSSLEIAKRLKVSDPRKLIVFGGPQVPRQAKDFLEQNRFIDIVVHGEGERAFLELLEGYPEREYANIASISYIDGNGRYVSHPTESRISSISDIPSPYLEGTFDLLMGANPNENWIALWETNRGCPFSCTYCDWGSSTQSKVFTFDLERIAAEIDWFAEHRINYVFCCDANFGILPRDIEIAELIAKAKRQFGFPRNVGVQNTKNTTDRAYRAQRILMDAALTNGVTLALQSLNEDTIKQIKRQNISLKAFQELQERFNRDGIVTYTDIILGLPGETYKSFTEGISKVIEGGQHNRIILSLLSILPNAEMGDPEYQRRHGLLVRESIIVNTHGVAEDYGDEICEVQELVLGTAAMPRQEWKESYRFGWMANFLYYTKVIQIPLLIAYKHVGLGMREMIDHFICADQKQYPLMFEISEFIFNRAQDIQSGEPEHLYRREWLGIYWPDDEYLLIRLSIEGMLDQFYEESKALMSAFLNNGMSSDLLGDAFRLNREMLKQPFQTTDVTVELNYDVLSYWRSIKADEEFSPERNPVSYRIRRKEEVWMSWEDWMREVVWYRNRSGAYLYEDIVRIK